MPKVSINILTKNRPQLLRKALDSIYNQNFKDFEVVLIDDGSTDETHEIIESYKSKNSNFVAIKHQVSEGITKSRQEALNASTGDYIAIVDDDDKWSTFWNDENKLKIQSEYLDQHQDYVLVGGGMNIISGGSKKSSRMRPETDFLIRISMLLRNNFFTSTVMFRRKIAIQAGGFIKDNDDFAEDYDLWLRMGLLGKMYNFQKAFVNYESPSYSKTKFKGFLEKQLRLIKKYKKNYSGYWLALCILKIRLF